MGTGPGNLRFECDNCGKKESFFGINREKAEKKAEEAGWIGDLCTVCNGTCTPHEMHKHIEARKK